MESEQDAGASALPPSPRPPPPPPLPPLRDFIAPLFPQFITIYVSDLHAHAMNNRQGQFMETATVTVATTVTELPISTIPFSTSSSTSTPSTINGTPQAVSASFSGLSGTPSSMASFVPFTDPVQPRPHALNKQFVQLLAVGGAIITIAAVVATALICCCCRRRRRKRLLEDSDTDTIINNQQMTGTTSETSIFSARPYIAPLDLTSTSMDSSSPHSPHSPISRPPPVLLPSNGNHSYLTGMDTSDHASISDNTNERPPSSHNSDEPPPPYRPRSTISRLSGVNIADGMLPNYRPGHSIREQEEFPAPYTNPFEDPLDEDNEIYERTFQRHSTQKPNLVESSSQHERDEVDTTPSRRRTSISTEVSVQQDPPDPPNQQNQTQSHA